MKSHIYKLFQKNEEGSKALIGFCQAKRLVSNFLLVFFRLRQSRRRFACENARLCRKFEQARVQISAVFSRLRQGRLKLQLFFYCFY